MSGIINSTNATVWHKIGAGIANMWQEEAIVAPKVNIALKIRNIANGTVAKSMNVRMVTSRALPPFEAVVRSMNGRAMVTASQGISVASTALVPFKAAAGGMNAGAMATAAQGMGASTALVHFGAVAGGANAGAMATAVQGVSGTSTALVLSETATAGVGSGAMANSVWTMKGIPIRRVSFGTPTVLSEVIIEGTSPAAVSKTIAAETIAAETSVGSAAGSLLGKVAALGKSAWALAVAHPVIATMAVVAAIAIPALIVAWRRNNTVE
ncbi:MAG: hypothetical protein LBK24_02775 [Puniceicoccales bacterium]|jgi:hypothetical protein|nr:hypothetical protein [Puniceicoccales bacterium]